MKKLVILALALVSTSAFAGKKDCDPVKFLANVHQNCPNTNALYEDFINSSKFCAQYTVKGGELAVATSGGKALVTDKKNCDTRVYQVDSSGIKEMKIAGFAYMRSGDGQLYLIDARSNFFEVTDKFTGLSFRGNKIGQHGVKDFKAQAKVLHVILWDGKEFDVTPKQVESNDNRWKSLGWKRLQ